MKKIYSILLASVLTFSSCANFLDADSQGKLIEDVFFGEEEGALMSINAVYTQLRAWDIIGFSWFAITELPGNNSDTGSEPADGSVARLNLSSDFTYDASAAEINGWQEGNYKAIASCGVALGNLGTVGNEKLRVKCAAQTRFFQGFFYFNPIRAFGEAPLVAKVLQPGEYNQLRAAEDAIYQQIIEDLTYTVEHLPTCQEWGVKESGHTTKGTAEGLLAKVYLFRGGYTNAEKYTGQMIARDEYSLHLNYRDLFNPNSYYSNEVMPTDQYLWGKLTERSLESEYVEWQGIRGVMGWGMFSPSEAPDQAHETGDPRRTATIFYDGETLEGRGEVHFKKEVPPRANKKTIWPTGYWDENSFVKQNCHLISLRYADMLPMYVETYNELGETRETLDRLEMVRARVCRTVHPVGMTVGLPEITETGKEKLREITWNERRIELALEGHRFSDLIHTDKMVPGYAEKMMEAHGKTNFSIAKHATSFIPQKQMDILQGVLRISSPGLFS